VTIHLRVRRKTYAPEGPDLSRIGQIASVLRLNVQNWGYLRDDPSGFAYLRLNVVCDRPAIAVRQKTTMRGGRRGANAASVTLDPWREMDPA
jgi:hypothetical protein